MLVTYPSEYAPGARMARSAASRAGWRQLRPAMPVTTTITCQYSLVLNYTHPPDGNKVTATLINLILGDLPTDDAHN